MTKKVGRPSRHEGEKLVKSRTFRVRNGLDEKLLKSSIEAGRSVSEEIEYRLELSYTRDRLFKLLLG